MDYELPGGRARLAGSKLPPPPPAVQVARVSAVGIGRACQEHAEPSAAPEQLFAAVGAWFAGRLARLLARHLFLRPRQVAFERLVELLHRLHPPALTPFDLVEGILHLRPALDGHDLPEVRLQLVPHRHAELPGPER